MMNLKTSLTPELISEARLEKALHYLATTDERFAHLKVELERKRYLLELARKKQFLLWTGTIDERKAQAETSKEVQDSIDAELDAMLRYEKERAKRTTETLIVDVYRTQEASRRVGNI